MQQLMACRSFLPGARHFQPQRGGWEAVDVGASYRDYYVRLSYLNALETAAEVRAARACLCPAERSGASAATSAAGTSSLARPTASAQPLPAAPGEAAEDSGERGVYEQLQLSRDGTRLSGTLPPRASPPRPGDSLLIDTVVRPSRGGLVRGSGEGGGAGGGVEALPARRFRLLKVAQVQLPKQGGLSSAPQLISFGLEELDGAYPASDPSAPKDARPILWEPEPSALYLLRRLRRRSYLVVRVPHGPRSSSEGLGRSHAFH